MDALNWIAYDDQGQECARGTLGDGANADVPDYGAISVEVAPGRFLSVTISEWGCVWLGPRPVNKPPLPLGLGPPLQQPAP